MSKRKLLLADDSVTIQKVVNLTFADEGIEVIAFGDGDSAMEKLAEVSPDLVMVDVNMPGLNGYQICERIRQDEVLRHIPVILLVGSFEPFDEEESNRVGADDYLTKPFQSIRQLVSKVTALLNSNTGKLPADDRHFADTLEMENPQPELMPNLIPPVQFEDSAMDDEMIQTSQVSSYTLDESSRFETKEPVQVETDLTKTQPLTTEEIKGFGLSNEVEEPLKDEVTQFVAENTTPPVEDEITQAVEDEIAQPIEEEISSAEETIGDGDSDISAVETIEPAPVAERVETIEEMIETAPKPIAELFETSETIAEEKVEVAAESSEQTVEEPAAEVTAPEQVTEEIVEEAAQEVAAAEEVIESPIETVTETHEDVMPMPEVASILQIDEANPLELPPIESDSESDESEPELDSAPAAVGFAHTPTGNTFSPDLIEAIAQKVMEKLSEKAVKEVAWEVVPQMTEIIVKKMAEENLKK